MRYDVGSFRRCWSTTLDEVCSPDLEYWCSQFMFPLLEEEDRNLFDPVAELELGSLMASMVSASCVDVGWFCYHWCTEVMGDVLKTNLYFSVSISAILVASTTNSPFPVISGPIPIFTPNIFLRSWDVLQSVYSLFVPDLPYFSGEI